MKRRVFEILLAASFVLAACEGAEEYGEVVRRAGPPIGRTEAPEGAIYVWRDARCTGSVLFERTGDGKLMTRKALFEGDDCGKLKARMALKL